MGKKSSNTERIAALETALQSAQSDTQKYVHELEKLRQRYADDLFEERRIAKRLQEERQRLQRGYEQLRVQKGGFGLKMLLLSGFAGFVSGLLFCLLYFLFLQPKDKHTAAFDHFRQAHLFNYERAISQGDFQMVEQDLQHNLDAPENKLIRPEIEFAKKIVGAARRRCE